MIIAIIENAMAYWGLSNICMSTCCVVDCKMIFVRLRFDKLCFIKIRQWAISHTVCIFYS